MTDVTAATRFSELYAVNLGQLKANGHACRWCGDSCFVATLRGFRLVDDLLHRTETWLHCWRCGEEVSSPWTRATLRPARAWQPWGIRMFIAGLLQRSPVVHDNPARRHDDIVGGDVAPDGNSIQSVALELWSAGQAPHDALSQIDRGVDGLLVHYEDVLAPNMWADEPHEYQPEGET